MIDKSTRQAVGQRVLTQFRDAGAVEVAPDILQPAETLLDLYGEDIRARAYVTHDPIRGEMMMRPDFTVPVVQMHMANGAEPARYCYLGEVFRKQDHGDIRPEHPRENEYLQAGYELFARDDSADAEVFLLFSRILSPFGLTARMGDMRLMLDAIRALPLSQVRRDTLLHYIWSPMRFRSYLERFSAPPRSRDFAPATGPWTGLRSPAEMQTRIDRLARPADAPLASEWSEGIRRLLNISAPAPQAMEELRRLACDMPEIGEAVGLVARRFELIAAGGHDLGQIHFDPTHGRQAMEYYDGVTFSFTAPGHDDWPPVATGGRYDALARVLGQGQEPPRAIPAVGGIIRPGLIAELESA